MAPRLTIIKRFSYRGAQEEYSNTYALTGTDPASNAEWLALADALIAQERTLHDTSTVFVRAYGYTSDAEDATAVWSRDYVAAGNALTGTMTLGTGAAFGAGDQAAWVRWKTDRLTSKGKPIYLRKYFHRVQVLTATPDTLATQYRTNLVAFGTKLWDGTFVDGRKVRRPGDPDAVIVGSNASVYVTTRTLKRRGKRPTSA